jgi:hypothetical protein
MNSPVRRKCYFELREVLRKLAEEYAEKHPEWAGDARAVEGTEWTVKLYEDIFRVLDHYNLTERPSASKK